MKNIVIKRVNESKEVLNIEKRYVGDLKEYVNADFYPESVELSSKGLFCCVDEDGYPKNLDFNIFIPTLNPNYPIQRLVGNVVFYRLKPVNYSGEIYDYEIGDLTEKDYEIINKILSENEQKRYEKMFNAMYNSVDDYIKPIIRGFKR